MLSWGVDRQSSNVEARITTDPWPQVDADALAIGFFEGEPPLDEAPDAISQAVRHVWVLGDFQGKAGESAVVYPTGAKVARVVLVGLGKRDDFTTEKARKYAGNAATRMRGIGAKRIALVPAATPGRVCMTEAAGAAAEGAVLGLYQHFEYRTEKRDEIKVVTDVAIVVPEGAAEGAEQAVREASVLASAVCWIRTLVNRPGDALTAGALADEARKMAETRGIRCRIIEKPELEQMGMGCLLGVNAGSAEPARLIVLEYDGTSEGQPLALVGKGITFDTGGLCIKKREGLQQMKDDMTGGGAVLGALRVAADLGLPVRLVGIVPATDNMPGSGAIKPGDVLRSYSGLTVEVQDTDAEGRLVLADGLAFAVKDFRPRAVIDLATLTGSIYVALGAHASGMFTLDDRMAKILYEAGQATGEKIWRMPLWPEYEDLVKSDIADVRNLGRKGDSDAIAAASMLKKFVGDVPWVHLDIAGTAWADKKLPYIPKGATGVGIRLLIQALRQGL